MMKAPVLLLTFNRPHTMIRVLEKIREAGVEELYVFNDGPRNGNANDIQARNEIRAIIDKIDWPCKVTVNYSDKNLGCGAGVSAGISWAFEHVSQLIILEDDCVPVLPFFSYCTSILNRYENDTRVWMVSGNNYSEEYAISESYTFSHNAVHVHGWATWKRCWKSFDLYLTAWPAFNDAGGIASLFATKGEQHYWNKKYAKIYSNRLDVAIHTWDFQLVLLVFINGGLVVVPKKNLVSNIGYAGVHNETKNHSHDKRTDPDFEVSVHPPFVLVNRGYDLHHWKNIWMRKTPVAGRIKKKLLTLLNRITNRN